MNHRGTETQRTHREKQREEIYPQINADYRSLKTLQLHVERRTILLKRWFLDWKSALVCVNLRIVLHFVSVLLCVLCGSLAFAQGAKKPPEKPPPVERITEHVYRIGSATVDTAARTVVCPGEINMDDGPIEYLAVAPKGKLHESLLRVDIRPLYLQVALLMLDLEPKNVLKAQGDKATPQGDPVEIRVRWRDGQGMEQDVRAEELVAELPGERVMAKHDWVFTGSRILKEVGFEADVSKSLVAVWHDPAAILDNPLPGGADNGYIVNTKRVPKQGTRIEFVQIGRASCR